MRIRGPVEPVGDEASDAYWNVRPRASRLSASASLQSSEIPGRDSLIEEQQRLAQLHPDTVPRPKRWIGYRLVFDEIEFWQGQADRLHDRVLINRDEHSWKGCHLSP